MTIEFERKIPGRSKCLRAGGQGRILPPRLFVIGKATSRQRAYRISRVFHYLRRVRATMPM